MTNRVDPGKEYSSRLVRGYTILNILVLKSSLNRSRLLVPENDVILSKDENNCM